MLRIIRLAAFLACSFAVPLAQASFLEIKFEGVVTSSSDPNGLLFNAGVGDNTLVGEAVSGRYLIDLELSNYYSDDNEIGGDRSYSPDGLGLGKLFITSTVSIGSRTFELTNDVPLDSVGEEVYLINDYHGDDFVSNEDFWRILDEFFVPEEFYALLRLSVFDQNGGFLNGVQLDQEFDLFDLDLNDPAFSFGGSLALEAFAAVGHAQFALTHVSAARLDPVPSVPEPPMAMLMASGLLMLAGRKAKLR